MITRRDTLAFLAAMPAVSDIRVASLQPKDVIIIKSPGPISTHEAARIKQTANGIWPHNEVLILGDGLDLVIAKG